MDFMKEKKNKLLLLMAPAGAGKTTFLYAFEKELNDKNSDFIVIIINLQSIENTFPKLMEDQLIRIGFEVSDIVQLKNRKILLLLDGYDELS